MAPFLFSWEQRKLGDMGSFKNGMNFSKDAMGKGYPFVNLQDILGHGVINAEKLGLAEASNMQLKEYNLQRGDVLFVRSSVKLEGVGEAALVPEHLKNTTYSGFVIRFRDESHMNYYYKRFAFSTASVRNQILTKATNSANKNISQGVLSNLQITIPLGKEQEEIGVFFTKLSDLITLHQRRSYIRQMQKKHFRIRYTSTWEQRKFGALCSIVTKQTGFDYTATIKKSLLTSPSKDTLPYLQTKNFTGRSIDYNTDYYIPRSVAKDFPKINLDVRCILFSIVGASVGNIGLFPGDKHCFLSGAICVSKPTKQGDTDYLYHFMCSKNGQNQIQTCTKGGAQATITIEDIRDFDVSLPSIEERSRLGYYLSSLDNLITLHQRE